MTIKIYDRAIGFVQFEADTTDPLTAWKLFGDELGYDHEEEGVFEKSAYAWTEKAEITDVSECQAFGEPRCA
jgi:hypothetical protein